MVLQYRIGMARNDSVKIMLSKPQHNFGTHSFIYMYTSWLSSAPNGILSAVQTVDHRAPRPRGRKFVTSDIDKKSAMLLHWRFLDDVI
jgi:hypothetical protein